MFWTASWAISSPPCCGRRSAGACPPAGCSRWPPGWWPSGSRRSRPSCPRSTGRWTSHLRQPTPTKLPFTAHYLRRGRQEVRAQVRSEADGQASWRRLKNAAFAVKTVKRTDKQRSPAPPFTTSTLQQEASRKLNMTPRRTMAIAQQLYEGVDIDGRGHRGSDHLYAYRLPAHLRRGHGRRPRAYTVARYGAGLLPRRAPAATRPRPGPRTPTRPSVPPTWRWTPEQREEAT